MGLRARDKFARSASVRSSGASSIERISSCSRSLPPLVVAGCPCRHRGARAPRSVARPIAARALARSACAALTLTLLGACSRLALDDSGSEAPPTQPPALASEHPTIGLVAAVGAPSLVRADWRSASPQSSVELALFVGATRATLFDERPRPLATPSGFTLVTDAPSAPVLFVGLGMRAPTVSAFVPAGPVLTVRAGSVVFVDPSASAAGGDGASPETAFGDLQLGILTALANGTSNVWVLEGDIQASTLVVPTGVSVSGGFSRSSGMQPAARELARPTRKTPAVVASELSELLVARNVEVHATRWIASTSAQPIVKLAAGSAGPACLDGVRLDGEGLAASGVDGDSLDVELRSVTVRDCQRGIKLRATDPGAQPSVVLTGVVARGALLEGLSVEGAFDLAIDGSLFELNGNEGADFNPLVAPEQGVASLAVRGSRFDRNGRDGLDVRLAAPAQGSAGGRFAIDVQDCDFELNATEGLRVDIDYDEFPAWRAQIVVRGARMRANGGAGLHLDLDARADVIVHRVSSTANRGDGIRVSSEAVPGMVTLSACAAFANSGAGVRALDGRFAIASSHCFVSGNSAGGVRSELVRSSAASCIAYIQSAPWTGTLAHAALDQASADPAPCLRSAREFARIVGGSGGALVLDAAPAATTKRVCEVDDDGVLRAIASSVGTTLALAPPPSAIAPGVVAFFDAGDDVREDLRLSQASLARDAGMAAPSAPAVDAGPFAATFGGAPGRDDDVPPPLFFAGSTDPPWTDAIDPSRSIVVRFANGAPDRATLPLGVFAVDARGVSLAIHTSVVDDALHIAPPAGGWPAGAVIELYSMLRSNDGTPLAVPVALPLRVE